MMKLEKKVKKKTHGSCYRFVTVNNLIVVVVVALVFVQLFTGLISKYSISSSKDGSGSQAPLQPTNGATDSASAAANAMIKNPFDNPEAFGMLVRRGTNLLTTNSGCRISRWFVTGGDCNGKKFPQKVLGTNFHKIKANDTIYVPLSRLKTFVREILPNITVEVVIISGRFHNYIMEDNGEVPVSQIVKSQYVLHFFCMNLPRYGGVSPRHPKISPFPYGLKESGFKPTMKIYRKILLSLYHNNNNNTELEKHKLIFDGAPRPSGSIARAMIHAQVGRVRMDPEAFFQTMADSTYVLSPDGDRPDCYRHYEAIGLGATPVTELDADLYRHLGKNAIYNNSDWNLTTLRKKLLVSAPNRTVNRNLVFDEYWMGHCDQVVGRLLPWWDIKSGHEMYTRDILLNDDVNK